MIRQIRRLDLSFNVKTLTEADRLNNIEWMGWTQWADSPMRYWHETDENGEYPKGWSTWNDDMNLFEVAVYKRNGLWIVEDTDLIGMFEGTKPVASTIPEG